MWSESSNLQTTITSTSRVLTGMTRWLAPSLACEKAWSGPKNGFLFHWRRALVCSHSISKAAENHYWDSSLIVSMFYLLQLLLSPLPLHLLVLCAPKQKKKANTTVGIVHTNQDFVQHLASKFTILSETEHWKWTIFFSCTLSYAINKCKCYFAKIRGTSVRKTILLKSKMATRDWKGWAKISFYWSVTLRII